MPSKNFMAYRDQSISSSRASILNIVVIIAGIFAIASVGFFAAVYFGASSSAPKAPTQISVNSAELTTTQKQQLLQGGQGSATASSASTSTVSSQSSTSSGGSHSSSGGLSDQQKRALLEGVNAQ